MRITKEPEERRQEIIEVALKIFNQKGYEKTSINDIAKEMNVAQGLCYRYFSSKEELFDIALNQYAEEIVERLYLPIKDKNMNLKQIVEDMKDGFDVEDGDYYELFHGEGNEKFHNELSLKVCEKLVPIVKKLLDEANEIGEIVVEDTELYATFFVYGQLGILLNEKFSLEEKRYSIRKFFMEILEL